VDTILAIIKAEHQRVKPRKVTLNQNLPPPEYPPHAPYPDSKGSIHLLGPAAQYVP
jgi:hypothetical protein